MSGLSQVQLDTRAMRYVEKTGAAIVNGNTQLFTVTGVIAIVNLYGRVTTGASGSPNFNLKADLPEGLTALCTTAALTGFTTINRAILQGNPANPLVFNNTALAIRLDYGHRIIEAAGAGGVYQSADAADDGVWAWELLYLPLRPGSRVVAA